MMFFHEVKIDERMRSNTLYAAAIWLGVTQLMLVGVIFYRLYVLDQPDAEIRDFQAVMAISLFGYLALQLFLGGVMPIPTWRGALAVYLALTSIIVTVCLIIYGWPKPEEWASTWLPAVSGPALLVCGYVLVARLGQWRVERQIERLNE
jgi:phosphoglycerol transferase MdoB-like AlkP superfamily enzyme